MKNWINVHNHTIFSLLDGHSVPERYADRCRELQMGAAAITDHGNIHGWLDFYDACKKHDLKPILGLEAYQARKTRFDQDEEERSGRAKNEWEQRGPYHLTLLAQNYTGYQNIIKISSRSYTEGFYGKPRIDYELLSEHGEGVIVLSGCLNGAVQQALLRGDFDAAVQHASQMQDIVGKDNYYIEIQDHGIDEQLRVKEQTLEIAKLIGARVVATGDCHYVRKEDAYHHDVMLCNGTGARIDEEDRFKFAGPHFYLHSYEEMLDRFEPEWLDNTLDLADSVDLHLEFGEFHFPHYPDVPEEQTVGEHLEELTMAGLKEKYGDPLPSEVIARVTHELGVIERMGFQHYFLVVSDLIRWANQNGIRTGFGRGSAAGSIVSYALGITKLDPIKFGLLFDRFLIEGRKTMPDIDLDFDDRYRDRVIEYARQKYGPDRVAHIATFQSIGARQAIRDACRVLGYEYMVGDVLAKKVPPPVLGVSPTLAEALESPDLLEAYNNDPVAKHVLDTAKGIEGVLRAKGIHPAGVVIAPGPIIDYIPVMQDKGPMVTQWDMYKVERNGMLKVDFLGLRNLSVIDMAVENIKEIYGIEIDPFAIPIDDEETFVEQAKGNTIGMFQIEGPGMQEMTMAIKPNSVMDLMAILSLYRPGPMGSGMDAMYINRKHGRESIAVPHPLLKDILEESYGIMLYQEDVLNVIKTLAAWSPGEADDLRRVMGKKDMKNVGKYREKFVKDCKRTHNINEALANKIYSDIEKFAGYGFNRAHAASYAMFTYLTGWFKTHYPAEYMAALLTSVANSENRLPLYLNECRRMGIEVKPPSINESDLEFKVDKNGDIVFGFMAIDGIGRAKGDALVGNERNYTSLYDFLRRSDYSILNKATLSHLLASGALDELIHKDVGDLDRDIILDLLEQEKTELGFYITDHPLSDIWPHVEMDITHTLATLEANLRGERVTVGGIISKMTKRTTKKGMTMYNLSFQDITGTIEVVVFPRDAKRIDLNQVYEGAIGHLDATVAADGDDENPMLKLIFNNFIPMDTSTIMGGLPIFLKVNHNIVPSQVERIEDMIRHNPGDSPVFIDYEYDGWRYTLQFKGRASYDIKDDIESIVRLSEMELEWVK